MGKLEDLEYRLDNIESKLNSILLKLKVTDASTVKLKTSKPAKMEQPRQIKIKKTTSDTFSGCSPSNNRGC